MQLSREAGVNSVVDAARSRGRRNEGRGGAGDGAEQEFHGGRCRRCRGRCGWQTVWYESDAVPEMISDEVLHVRVSALNVRSYNGGGGGLSDGVAVVCARWP